MYNSDINKFVYISFRSKINYNVATLEILFILCF